MLDIGFFKGQPTHYIVKFVAGQVTREGMGLSFVYLKHNTSIVAVPTSSTDTNFVFNELTSNFQAVTLQGQFTYRIANARQAASLLNFTIHSKTHTYKVYFLSARPTPEVAKALEAEYRETLLGKADEAIYRRRGAAVEEERKIKENELNSDITLEQQRQQLIELQGGNAQQEAEYRGRALEREAEYRSRAMEMELGAYRSLEAGTILALALKELGENAGKIGNLTITSEILAALLDSRPPRQGR